MITVRDTVFSPAVIITTQLVQMHKIAYTIHNCHFVFAHEKLHARDYLELSSAVIMLFGWWGPQSKEDFER